jgi:hypothetical protein
MLVDELHLSVAAEQHAKIIEPGDVTLQLHPVYEIDGDGGLALANGVEKCVLKVLWFVVHG